MLGSEPLTKETKMSSIKQVIVLRKDLNMRKGKMIAQGAHASMKVILDLNESKTDDFMLIPLNAITREWFLGSFAKIALSVDSEHELMEIHHKAKRAELPCTLITDAGRTEFKGVPTNTAVAIGPAKSEDIDKITGDLKLL